MEVVETSNLGFGRPTFCHLNYTRIKAQEIKKKLAFRQSKILDSNQGCFLAKKKS